MIIVDFIGRLGNQMFQYAFALSTAKKHRTWFIHNPIYSSEITKWFKLDWATQTLFDQRFAKFNRIILRYFLPKLEIQTQDGWEIDFSSNNNLHYEGFFQSENYFKEYNEIIRKRLSIKKKYTNLFKAKYGDTFSKNKILTIHIRRTDYIDFGSDRLGGIGLCLPLSYYENCLKNIENIHEYKVFCISDDIEFGKEIFKNKRNFTFVNEEMIIDFQFLLNADICILANSSFAWWGAYLNKKKHKIIFTPKYWLGFKINEEYPKNIIPNEFVKINVY